jgi:hypothetical protein
VLGVFDEVLDLGVMPVPVLNLRGCLGCGDIEVGQDERLAVHDNEVSEFGERQGALVGAQVRRRRARGSADT